MPWGWDYFSGGFGRLISGSTGDKTTLGISWRRFHERNPFFEPVGKIREVWKSASPLYFGKAKSEVSQCTAQGDIGQCVGIPVALFFIVQFVCGGFETTIDFFVLPGDPLGALLCGIAFAFQENGSSCIA